MILVAGALVRVHYNKCALTTAINALIHHAAAHDNGNASSRRIAMCGEARRPCKQGRLKEAIHSLDVMDQRDIRADYSTYAALLQECINKKALAEGRLIHAHMAGTEFNPEMSLGDKLVTMYAKCGSLVDARRVLDGMPCRNVVSWTVMISAYARHGYSEEALALFCQMQRTGVQPNQFTFASVLPACGNLAAPEHGRKVHESIISRGFESNIFVGNALVDMYAKCGRTEDAHQVFDKMPERDVVSWTAIVDAYAHQGHADQALRLFQKMPERDAVSWSAMIAGFVQSEQFDAALKLFHHMPEQDVASWNAMIAGCAQNGNFAEALNLFQQMWMAAVNPNAVTFASVLPACANLAALELGKDIHTDIHRSGLESNVFVGNALVDMYAKCGSLEDARQVFDKMSTRNVVSWNSMIAGYSMHGCGKEALQLFERMQLSGTKPDCVTLVGVLSACCHGGLVDEGWQHFNRMGRDYHITPAVEHYCCMVDLLGRTGRLDDAKNFIYKMPIKPNAAVWGPLLGACRIHNNIELAEHVAERLFELAPQNAANYVLLSNIYAAAGRWDDVEKVQKLRNDRMIKKSPGCSWIEVNNKLHYFCATDRSDPQMHEDNEELERLYG